MTQQEKAQFITDICNSVRESLSAKLDKTPEQWDGRELRQWIADYVSENVNYLPMDRSRMRAYRNVRLVDNL